MDTKKVGELIRVHIKVTIAVLLSIVSLIIILLYIICPPIRDELTFATAVVGGSSVIYAGYYTGISVRLANKQAKMEHSFKIINLLNTEFMARIEHLIEDKGTDPNVAPQNLYRSIHEDKSLQMAVVTVLGLWDDVSIGIRLGYFDEEVLFYSLSFLVPWHVENLIYFIRQERERFKDPYVFWEVERLAGAWKDNKSLVTGETFKYPD